MKKLTFLLILLFSVFQLKAQEKQAADSVVNWLSLNEAFSKQKDSEKVIFIFVYSEKQDKNRYSKKMIDSTFRDATVASFLNKRFYPVLFNADMETPIQYFDSVYTNENGIHDLSRVFLDNKVEFPSVTFFRGVNMKSSVAGYQDATNLIPLLVYILEEVYNTTSLDDYKEYFFKTYPPGNNSGYSMVRSLVKWKSLEEALEMNEQNPKRIFIDFNVNWNTACTMMSMQTYNDPVIAKILNEKYYPVRINALTRDTIVFGETYVNLGPDPHFHQLPYSMLQGNMKFPVTLYLDQNSKLINTVYGYFTPKGIEPVLMYYGSDAYKKKSWQSHVKEFKGSFEE